MTEKGYDEQGRPEPPLKGDEWQTVSGFLDYQRATFAWKTAGLDAKQLDRTVGSSTMTLGGLMKHLAYVEDDWFGRWLWNEPRREPWASVDWVSDPDWEWRSAAYDSPDELLVLWTTSVERARMAAARAASEEGLDRRADRSWSNGNTPTLRWILIHMIEEYARHNGHADLIRESVDGLTGE